MWFWLPVLAGLMFYLGWILGAAVERSRNEYRRKKELEHAGLEDEMVEVFIKLVEDTSGNRNVTPEAGSSEKRPDDSRDEWPS